MIFLYLLFFVLGITTFFLLHKLKIFKRLFIAFLVFAILSIILTITLIVSGDKPTTGAQTITSKELNQE